MHRNFVSSKKPSWPQPSNFNLHNSQLSTRAHQLPALHHPERQDYSLRNVLTRARPRCTTTNASSKRCAKKGVVVVVWGWSLGSFEKGERRPRGSRSEPPTRAVCGHSSLSRGASYLCFAELILDTDGK